MKDEGKEWDKYANVLKEIKGNKSSHRRELGSIPGQPMRARWHLDRFSPISFKTLSSSQNPANGHSVH